MQAATVYEHMRPMLDATARSKDHRTLELVAEKWGFRPVDTPASSTFINLCFRDPAGVEVWIVAWWHDPSGPFQNCPDINKIRLSLKSPGQSPTEYQVQYTD